MVAPANTQAFPLQHHYKGSNASTSFRNYSRIQSEVQRDGFEVHKENLLSLATSKNAKPCGAMRMGTPSHGLSVQDKEHDTHHVGLQVSGDPNCPVGLGTADNPSFVATFLSSSAAFRPLALGEETFNAYNHYAEMFLGTHTSVNACMPVSYSHGEREFCSSTSLTGEMVGVVQYLPDVKSVEDSQEDKRPESKENSCIELFNKQNSKQGNPCCLDADGNCVVAARDGALQAGTGNTCEFGCASQNNGHAAAKPTQLHSSNGLNADLPSNLSLISGINWASACGTPHTGNLSKALPTVGLKLFTSSAHAQMPNALLTFSEGAPSLPLSLEQASNRLQRISTPTHENSCIEADWGKFLALSATPVVNETEAASARMLPFQQRFKHLQAFLKQRDEVDQNDCLQALRSLSGAARSGHAVELETRAIRLSLEEGKEIKRMRLLNVLGKISERTVVDDAGATPHGPRLPAPGVMMAKLKNAP